jgi:uncharacterized protein
MGADHIPNPLTLKSGGRSGSYFRVLNFRILPLVVPTAFSDAISLLAHSQARMRGGFVQCYSASGTVMESPIYSNLEAIAGLCRRYGVRRLAAFGSILRADFDPHGSDADFLVEFEPVPAAERMQNFLALREALGELLHRPVDLVEDGAIQNPYVLASLSEQQQILYAA